MAGMESEDVVRIDEVEMGEAGTADGIRAREKEKFEYIHGHVEHQELHVPPLDELCKGTAYVAMFSRDKQCCKALFTLVSTNENKRKTYVNMSKTLYFARGYDVGFPRTFKNRFPPPPAKT